MQYDEEIMLKAENLKGLQRKASRGSQKVMITDGDIQMQVKEEALNQLRLNQTFLDMGTEVLPQNENILQKSLESKGGQNCVIQQNGTGETRNAEPVEQKVVIDLKAGPGMAQIEKELLRKIHFIRASGDLHYYDPQKGCYQRLTEKRFARLLRENIAPDFAKKISGYGKIKDAYAWLCANPDIQEYEKVELYEKGKYLVTLNNGVWDARNNNFTEWSSDIPTFFRVRAEYWEEELPTPTFDGFLADVCQEDEVCKELIWDFLAYILMPCNDAKVMFVMADAPDSGKSVFAQFIALLFDNEDVSYVPLHKLCGRFSLASMADKIININMDLQDEWLSTEMIGNLKSITGDKTIQVESKFADLRSEVCLCRLIIGTNFAIKLRQKDPAFWSRVVILPFLYSCAVENQNKNLLKLLLDEKDAIVSKALKRCCRLINNNFLFPEPWTAKEMKDLWCAAKDEVDYFLEECCVVTGDPEDFLVIPDAYLEFSDYTRNRGRYPCTKNAFTSAVRERCPCPDGNPHNKKRVTVWDQSILVNVIWGVQRKKEGFYNVNAWAKR